MPTCKQCKKDFSSRLSLWMHYTASKVHRKNSPFYHKPELWELAKQKKKAKITPVKKSIVEIINELEE